MTGIPVLLGADRTPQECVLQTPGEGLRVRADHLRRVMAASRSLHCYTVDCKDKIYP